ncbi:MAG: hypothetical protein ACM3PZ_04080 [Bacillota bacterium]
MKKMAVAVILLILACGAYYLYKYPSFLQRPSSDTEEGMSLEEALSLDDKQPGTKAYYSENLGLAFTYLPDENYNPEIRGEGNKLIVGDQEAEVFQKDPALSLQEAIEANFLVGYDPSQCFVKILSKEEREQKPDSYEAAVISFPHLEDANLPWWSNGDKCPTEYSETNGLQYFLMNKEVPSKYLFVRVGQSAGVLDGIAEPLGNWTRSLRVVK